MSDLVADCPRCGAQQITFELVAARETERRNGWQRCYEAFCICRACGKSTIYALSQKTNVDPLALSVTPLPNFTNAVNNWVTVERYVSLKDVVSQSPPDYLPAVIQTAFREGAACLAIDCPNAAGTMFRLCLDLATREKLPATNDDGLTNTIRRSLGLRLAWLFDTGRLPKELQDLSACIKDDGNDGAHEGTLEKADAEDILDFTYELLERLYTEPGRLAAAKKRRGKRRAPDNNN